VPLQAAKEMITMTTLSEVSQRAAVLAEQAKRHTDALTAIWLACERSRTISEARAQLATDMRLVNRPMTLRFAEHLFDALVAGQDVSTIAASPAAQGNDTRKS
jgi:hypothetical protein